MKRMLCVCAALVMALGTVVTAHASDVTGTWTAEMSMGDGNSFQMQFTFKQDGSTFTGTVLGPQGDAIAISDGKVDGDKLSFKVSFNGMTISHDGTISADGEQIKLSTKSDSGDFPPMELTLKRVKPTPPAPVPADAAAPQS
jgi:hypothetical protein